MSILPLLAGVPELLTLRHFPVITLGAVYPVFLADIFTGNEASELPSYLKTIVTFPSLSVFPLPITVPSLSILTSASSSPGPVVYSATLTTTDPATAFRTVILKVFCTSLLPSLALSVTSLTPASLNEGV